MRKNAEDPVWDAAGLNHVLLAKNSQFGAAGMPNLKTKGKGCDDRALQRCTCYRHSR